jgi:hypothetical protein
MMNYYNWHLKNPASSLVTASYLVELVDGGNTSMPRTSGALAGNPFTVRTPAA